ncbi:MAG: glutamine--fructose-6-phosphate transaminase (isomerizing) [Pseudomonadota bacterium]
MCGIVGVLGQHEAAPLLVEALKRLEYRGYDSAGIATLTSGQLDRRRAVGKLVNLSDLLVHEPLTGTAGIGHTRWATHGAPTVANAHPHRAGPVAVVHNGIIENYKALREELSAANLGAETETDTETIALLAHYYLNAGMSAVDAAHATLKRLEGAFALAFLFEGEDDLMVVARRGSPLAIGHGKDEVFVGSDALALAPMTDRVTYLEEGDWAVLTRHTVDIRDAEGIPVHRPAKTVRIDAGQIEKGGHRHFMAKEMAEQPTVLAETLAHYLPDGEIVLPAPGIDFAALDRVSMVACGTASFACHVAKYWFEQIAGLPADIDVASEYRYREPPMPPRTLSLFVSQSGETADTLAALRYAAPRSETVASIVNVPESTIARESALVLPTQAGAEIGVASTKAFTCQLAVLYLLALRAGVDRAALSRQAAAEKLAMVQALPGLLNLALARGPEIASVAKLVAEARDVLFLGRGPMFPLALEGALKLKEISYIHAEGYASGELKHGPIALVDKSVPVIVFAPRDGLFEKTVSNMQEVMARGGRVLLISDAEGVAEAGAGCWETLVMPAVAPVLAPILYAVPAQLLAYHTAVAKGTDVDQPRNLAKSVTVE